MATIPVMILSGSTVLATDGREYEVLGWGPGQHFKGLCTADGKRYKVPKAWYVRTVKEGDGFSSVDLAEQKAFRELAAVPRGAIIRMKDGKTGEFMRVNQTSLDVMIDGKAVRVSLESFAEVVSTEVAQKARDGYKKLKPGTLFYIVYGRADDIVLYVFEQIKNGKIIGRHPVNKTTIRIDPALYGGTVAELQKALKAGQEG